jgi:teichuronic acid exporter
VSSAISSIPASPARHSSDHLLRAIKWTAIGKWGSQLVAWLSTLVVIRILSPSDFGLIGLATAYLGLVELLCEFGIGTAVITLKNLTETEIAQLNTAAILLGLFGTTTTCALARPLSAFFHAPDLARLLLLMSLTFSIAACKSVPYALLQKDLEFKRISRLDAAQACLQAAGNALFVVLGFKYWGIALSGCLSSLVATYCFRRAKPVPLVKPAFASLRASLVFSWRILVSRSSWYLYSNSDFFVAGRMLGAASLGLYTFAWNFATLPGEKIVALVTSVTPTFFAAVQHDKALLRQRLLMLTEGLAALMLPIVAGLYLVAPVAIPLFFGKKWHGAVAPLQLLAAYTLLRSFITLFPQIINVVGQTRFGMWNSLVTLAVLPASFFLGSRWGVAGIAAVWVIVYPLLSIPLYLRTLRSINLSTRQYTQAIAPYALCTILMAVCVKLTSLAAVSIPPAAALACGVMAGAAVYPLAVRTLFPEKFRRYSGSLRQTLLGSAPK